MNALRWIMVGVIAMGSFGCAQKMVQAPPATKNVPPPVAEKPKVQTQPEVTRDAKVEFQPVFFDYDSFTLRADARSALDRNAEAMRKSTDLEVIIEGHCDERGTVEYNLALGEKRAKTARDYLVAAGISSSRIKTVSYGKERPFATGKDERSWAQNRRAHTVVGSRNLSSR